MISGLFRLGEDLVDSTMRMLRTVPNIAQTPLFTIWFGIGEAPKVALIALATVFPLHVNVYASIRNVDQTLVEVARGLGLSPISTIALRARSACRSGAP